MKRKTNTSRKATTDQKVGGLIAYIGQGSDSVDLPGAESVAPWRGTRHGKISFPRIGFISAQGNALAGIREHLAIGFHGRIDNIPEISSLLKTRSEDPLDLIAGLYLQKGDEFASHILGDFTIIVIDKKRLSLLAVRDWIGVRPLFWLKNGDEIAIATEIKQALALLRTPLKPAAQTLKAFMAWTGLDLTATFAEGVQAIPPSGQLLVCPGSRPQVWRRKFTFSPVKIGMAEAAIEIRRLLEISLERRLPAGVHAGIFLSGGVDSPAVAGTAANLAKKGVIQPLECCYTQALPEVPECDETEPASIVAKACNVPWKPVEITVADFRAWPQRAFSLHEGPVFATACGARMMFEAAKGDGLDTILMGTGGDEFADQSCMELRQSLFRREWSSAIRWIVAAGPRQIKGQMGIIARVLRDKLLHGHRAETAFENTAASFSIRFALEILEREATFHGITVEYPLLDFELASFLAGLPPKIKSTPAITKAALRESVNGLVPDNVRLNPRVIVYNAVLTAALGSVPSNHTLHTFLNSH